MRGSHFSDNENDKCGASQSVSLSVSQAPYKSILIPTVAAAAAAMAVAAAAARWYAPPSATR